MDGHGYSTVRHPINAVSTIIAFAAIMVLL